MPVKSSGKSERLRLQSIGRIYVPTQNANRHINEWAFKSISRHDPAVPTKLRDGVKLLNDLIEISPFRPSDARRSITLQRTEARD